MLDLQGSALHQVPPQSTLFQELTPERPGSGGVASVLNINLAMIIAVLRLLPLTNQREAILQILESMMAETSAKLGCTSCGVYEGTGFNRLIVYVEEWTSEEELHRHIQSTLYLRLLTTMDLCEDQPEISFHHVAQTEHLELIETLRANNTNPV